MAASECASTIVKPRCVPALILIGLAAAASGCAAASSWSLDRPLDPGAAGPVGPVFVMEPVVILRLMRLDPPALAGQVTFHNRARLMLNQRAIGLLNDRFREAVLQLLSGPANRRPPHG